MSERIESFDGEVWKPVEGTNGRYEVSNLGRVVSRTRTMPRLLAGSMRANGFLCVGITDEPRKPGRVVQIHHLVARHFLGEPPGERHGDVMHLDGNRHNNAATNLRWATRAEHLAAIDAQRRGRWKGTTYPPPPAARADPPAVAPPRRAKPVGIDRTADAALVQDCIDLYDEGHLSLTTAARLLRCTATTVGEIERTWKTRPFRTARPGRFRRRSKAEREEIARLIRAGRTREEVNAATGEALTHQAFYYYKQKANA